MKKSIILFAALSFAVFAGCKDTAKEETPTTTETEQAAPVDEHAGHNHGAEGEDHSGHGHDNASAGTSTAGLNPEHGQPRHRCDILVGMPLDTPIQNGGGTPTNATPQAAPSGSGGPFLVNDNAKQRIQQESGNTTATPSGTGKVNPPHGQPGHSCDVAAGAPL